MKTKRKDRKLATSLNLTEDQASLLFDVVMDAINFAEDIIVLEQSGQETGYKKGFGNKLLKRGKAALDLVYPEQKQVKGGPSDVYFYEEELPRINPHDNELKNFKFLNSAKNGGVAVVCSGSHYDSGKISFSKSELVDDEYIKQQKRIDQSIEAFSVFGKKDN